MSLPSGYRRLEYIQSSGTQYIDTGFKPNQDTRVTMDFNLLEIVNKYADPIFGVRKSASSKGFYFWASGYGTTTERYQSGYNNGSTYQQVTRLGRHYVDKNKNITTIDGVSTSATYTAFTTDWNMLLFNSYNNGNLYQNTKLKLYSCQIYDNGTLIRNYIPCQTSSGDIGLWDDVNSVFYGNAGTGTFTAGPVIAIAADKSEITKLEYIESSGTQYVDSGFKPNNNSRVVLDFEPTASYSSIVGIFGIRDTKSGTAANMFVFWNNGANTFRTDYFGTQKTMTVSTLLARQTVDKDKNVTTIGSVSVSNTVSTGQCSNNLYLFCTNNAGTAQYFAKLKLYSCQIYDNGTIIRDYIPAKLSDGTVGLYDKLNGLLYINAGTGAFEAGPSSLNLPVNIGGTWKEANEAFVNISGTWKAVKDVFVNIGGAWKELG